MSIKSPDPTDVLVGRNIRNQRVLKGLSQAQLAEQLGITFQQVQKYEKGANRVGSGRLVRIAEALKVPIMALFEGVADHARHAGEVSGPDELMADPQPLRLVRAFAEIHDAGLRCSIVALVENVAAISTTKTS